MRPDWRTVARYILSKLTGAGLGLFSMFCMIAMGARGDFYDPIRQLYLFPTDTMDGGIGRVAWTVFYVYGPICSVVIDALGLALPYVSRGWIGALLHALAGFAFFVPGGIASGQYEGTAIGGFFAACFALVFYAGSRLHRLVHFFQDSLFPESVKYAAMSILVVSLLVGAVFPLSILTVNMAYPEGVKKGWSETAGPASYEARFRYWNGTRKIVIPAQAGQTIRFRLEWHTGDSGVTGFGVKYPPGSRATLKEAPGGASRDFAGQIRADVNGDYGLNVSGEGVRGSFILSWTVE